MKALAYFTCYFVTLSPTTFGLSFNKQTEKEGVLMRNVITTHTVGITTCHLKCSHDKRCVAWGIKEKVSLGKVMECFLLKADKNSYYTHDYGNGDESVYLFVTETAGSVRIMTKEATTMAKPAFDEVIATQHSNSTSLTNDVVFIAANASSVWGDDNAKYGPNLGWTGRSTTNFGLFYSKQEDNPWLEIHLKTIALYGVTVINRKDTYGDYLKKLEVRGGLLKGLVNDVIGYFEGPGYTTGEHFIPFGQIVTIAYITFQIKERNYWLMINGITVYPVKDGVAFFSANASSVWEDNFVKWGPDLAWTGHSMTTTGLFYSKIEDNPWLQIYIQTIDIFGVTLVDYKACCSSYLKNLEVRGGMSASELQNEIIGNFKGPGSRGREYYIPFNATVKVAYITFKTKGNNVTLAINGITLHTVNGTNN